MNKKTALCIVSFFYFSFNIYAQLCQGSLGDPIVEIDFGSGTGRGSALGSSVTAFTYRASGELDEGEYTIANSTSGLKGNAWHITNDHTGNANGYMMVINSAVLANEGVFYTKSVQGLCPNTTYEFSAWLINVMNPTAGTDQYSPNVTFRVSDTSGNILGSYNTGDIAQTSSGTWIQYGFFFTLGNESEVIITILNSAPSAHPGNDIALDDISFRPCGPNTTTVIQNETSTNLTICQDDIVNYTFETYVSNGYSNPQYQWQYSDDNGLTWNNITGATSTTYNFTDTSTPGIFYYRMAVGDGANINSTSCRINSDEFTVEITKKPDPLVGDSQQSFCSTQNATLKDIDVNASAIWYDSLTKNNILPETTNLVNGTTYYATNINNGCESDEVLAVTVTIYTPSLEINNVNAFVCDNLNDGHELINLTIYEEKITSCSNCSFSYFLSQVDAENFSSDEKISSPSNYDWFPVNNIIYVRIDSPDNCYQIAEVTLNLQETPIININDTIGVCENADAFIIDAGAGYYAYSWSNGATTQTISITSEDRGYYWVEITEDHGTYICSSSKEFEVVASNIATISSIDIEDWTDYNNSLTVNLSNENIGEYEYSLDNLNYQDSNIFTGLEAGEYTVYVRDKNGCGITQKIVYILNYPKFFTPNNDGFNDTWSIEYSETEPNMIVKIFDRYGKFLKFLTPNTSWDGTFKGQNLPSSDYWFVVIRENGKIYKGHFALKR